MKRELLQEEREEGRAEGDRDRLVKQVKKKLEKICLRMLLQKHWKRKFGTSGYMVNVWI